MATENAVRALAGSLVLLGIGLGYAVHPGWLLLGVFVGLNLLQSAFTGFCPAERVFERLGVARREAPCGQRPS